MEHAGRTGRQRPGERPDRQPRGDRPDRDPALRAKYIKGRGEGASREREPDPNSPFAKLAKLKEQLEASTKEPR
jgi:ATP-dependent RNA helicase SUPV3L1/SUV3